MNIGIATHSQTYTDRVILETLGEGLSNRIVVLLLDNARGGVEDAEG